MTEEEWLACEDPQKMLHLPMQEGRKRKLRLFACAYCHRIESMVSNEWSRHAVKAAEAAADDPPESDLEHYRERAEKVIWELTDWPARKAARAAATVASADWTVKHSFYLLRRQWEEALAYVGETAKAAVAAVGLAATEEDRQRNQKAEIESQVELLRHIIGNPYQPYQAPDHWPSTVTDLAQALYDGDGNRLVLADALEEHGH